MYPLSLASMFTYSSRGKWAFPPLLWSFTLTTTFTSFPTPGCWVGAAAPAFSGRLIYLQFHEEFPHPPFGTQSTTPSLLCVFIVLIAYTQLLFFPRVETMLIWPRVVCGSTTYHLAHPVFRVFPSHLGAGDWRWPGGPPGFSL
jgi:hypothetical protein